MVTTLSEDITESPKAAAILFSEIMAREQVMSQVFPEIGIALLHSRSRAVKECEVITASCENNQLIEGKGLENIQAVICMVMPLDVHRKENSEMLGRISSAIIGDEQFLLDIQNGKEDAIRSRLQEILKAYFSEHLNEL